MLLKLVLGFVFLFFVYKAAAKPVWRFSLSHLALSLALKSITITAETRGEQAYQPPPPGACVRDVEKCSVAAIKIKLGHSPNKSHKRPTKMYE